MYYFIVTGDKNKYKAGQMKWMSCTGVVLGYSLVFKRISTCGLLKKQKQSYAHPKGVNRHRDSMGMVGGIGLEEVIKEV